MIDNNLLKVDSFYKEFNFENIVETPGYSVGFVFTFTLPSFIIVSRANQIAQNSE